MNGVTKLKRSGDGSLALSAATADSLKLFKVFVI